MSYDSGLPDAAFTEAERAAGVPSLMRGNSDWTSGPLPTSEIEPNCNHDELVALLVKGITSEPLRVTVESPRSMPVPAWIPICALDGAKEEHDPSIFITIEYDYRVPVSFLAKVLRESALPLFADEHIGAWVAWDSRDLCLRVDPPDLDWLWKSAEPKGEESGSAAGDRESTIYKFLRRSLLATDHGKKPLLLKNELLPIAMRREVVDFCDPKCIPVDALEQYVLAYHDSVGMIKSIPLVEVARFGYPVVTRNSAYEVKNGALLPLLSRGRLLADAYVIATSFHAKKFKFFLARERGTLFASALERVDFEDGGRGGLEAEIPCAGVVVAEEICEWSARQFGQVYITVEGHPLDSDLVTTPALYEQAVERLNQFGWSIYHSYGEKLMFNEKRDDEDNEDDDLVY